MGFLDIGYNEILVILVIILLVEAPDLPEYSRKLGQIIHNFTRYY